MSMNLEDVREYSEGMPVSLGDKNGRPTIIAKNQAGYDATEVDLLDLLEWARQVGWAS